MKDLERARRVHSDPETSGPVSARGLAPPLHPTIARAEETWELLSGKGLVSKKMLIRTQMTDFSMQLNDANLLL